MSRFKVTPPGAPEHKEMAAKVLKQNFAASLTPEQLLVVQYTKLANYFGDELDERWGGDFNEHRDKARIRCGLLTFLRDVQRLRTSPKDTWVTRTSMSEPWSRENVMISNIPSQELGKGFEPYLAIGGGMLTMTHAARILMIDLSELVSLKLRLIIDELVVEHGIRRMLLPRPEWPKIEAIPGGKGRALKFN